VSRYGFDHLSKLENLRKFWFWITDGVSEQQGNDKLVLLLQTVPKLQSAVCLQNFPDEGRLMDITSALNACSKPLLLRVVSVLPELLVRPLSAIVPHATQLDLINHRTFSAKCLGLEKVTELSFSGYSSQAAFDSTVQHYGRQLKVLKISRETTEIELNVVAENCPALERLECSSDCIPLPDRFDNPWPCLRHLVIFSGHFEYSDQILQCAQNIQSLCCDFHLLWQVLHNDARVTGHYQFPNLVKAVLNAGLAGKDIIDKFLFEAPKLQHLTLTDWPGQKIEWLSHVPGLLVVYLESY
jgi:hypothetical protein